MNRALITGISGQDGSYLAELLLSKGYEVHGVVRRKSQENFYPNISHIQDRLHLHYGDMVDSSSLTNTVLSIKPNEVYNLAAQSHVHASFQVPEYTVDTNGLGVLKLLESVKVLHQQNHPIRFYQAGTSEMFGQVLETPQRETTPFRPRSPYGASKVMAHWLTVNYRESYGLYASNGILFNHESPRRGQNFVTRKITYQISKILHGQQTVVKLGNLDSHRDWGHAKDYVMGMYLMMQQPAPNDFVLATGQTHTVREFCQKVCNYFDINLYWTGTGVDEKGIDLKTNKVIFECDPQLYRPAEVAFLLGDASLARNQLGWKLSYDIDKLVGEMCENDFANVEKEKHDTN